jgi:hypothetical protein
MWKSKKFFVASISEDLYIGTQMHKQYKQLNQLAQLKLELEKCVEEFFFEECMSCQVEEVW